MMAAGNRRLVWILPGLFLALLLAVPSLAQGAGTIEGVVVNETEGGPAVGAGLPVTLRIIQGETELAVQEAATDTGGGFRFDELDASPDQEYWVEVVYLGVPYTAGPFTFDEDQNLLEANVSVYETTEDDAGVVLDSVHIIAQSFGSALRVTEILLFGNRSDRAFIGSATASSEEQRSTVFVPLPESAVGLAFEEGTAAERYQEVPGGIADTEPVPPGSETSLTFFSYHLMVEGDSVELERSFAYPVGILNVLAAQPGLGLRSDQLQVMGPEAFQGQQYNFYAGGSLDAGESITVELVPVAVETDASGSPVTGGPAGIATRGNQGLIRLLGLGLVGLALIGLVAYTAGSRSPSRSVQTVRPLRTNPEARRLVRELADLEDAHDAGMVDDARYERERAEKHEALKALWR